MTRRAGLLKTLVIAAGCVSAIAAANPAIGVWEVVSTGAEDMHWTLTVREEGGKLSGTLSGGRGKFGLIEPKIEGDTFTFKVVLQRNTFSVRTKISGNKLSGTYDGPGMSGAIEGIRQ